MIYSFCLLYYRYSGYEFSEQNFKISYFLNGSENLMISSDLLPFKFKTVKISTVIGMNCIIFFIRMKEIQMIFFNFFYH